jgi:hypothetical protein
MRQLCRDLEIWVPVAAIVVVLAQAPAALSCQCNTTVNFAFLSELFAATGGNFWAWGNASVPICQWFGVGCEGPNITSLSLSQNNLSGMIPHDWKNLSSITSLDFSENSITGPLPLPITQLVNLSLDSNHLDGTLPSSWSAMTRLQTFALDINHFNGTLPSSWSTMTQLQSFYLSGNDLSGTLPESWVVLESCANVQANPTIFLLRFLST